MSRYTLRYLDFKVKKFNKLETLKKFAYRNAYKIVDVTKDGYLIPLPLPPSKGKLKKGMVRDEL